MPEEGIVIIQVYLKPISNFQELDIQNDQSGFRQSSRGGTTLSHSLSSSISSK
jgi:hypothetical protein